MRPDLYPPGPPRWTDAAGRQAVGYGSPWGTDALGPHGGFAAQAVDRKRGHAVVPVMSLVNINYHRFLSHLFPSHRRSATPAQTEVEIQDA